jgi:hypothetical protein
MFVQLFKTRNLSYTLNEFLNLNFGNCCLFDICFLLFVILLYRYLPLKIHFKRNKSFSPRNPFNFL